MSGDGELQEAFEEEQSRYAELETVELDGTVTVDLYDRVDELLDEAIPATESDIAEVEQELREAEEPTERLELSQEKAELEERLETQQHTARVFHSCAEAWGGSEFTLKRNLNFHEVQAASDDIAEMTVASGKPQEAASAKEGAYKLRVLMFGIEDAPPEAPNPNDDGFPWQVGNWLYQQFDAINSRGDVSVGNSSSTGADRTE